MDDFDTTYDIEVAADRYEQYLTWIQEMIKS